MEEDARRTSIDMSAATLKQHSRRRSLRQGEHGSAAGAIEQLPAHATEPGCSPMTRFAAVVPLLAVFVLALLMGFVGRVIIAPDAASMLRVSAVSGAGASARFGGATDPLGSGPHRRKLGQGGAAAAAMMLPFRLNPLAGQLPRSQDASEGGLDPTAVAPRGIGAPAARGIEQGSKQDSAAAVASMTDATATEAMAGESAPGVDPAGELARRMGPAAAPGASVALAASGASAPNLAPNTSLIRPVHDAAGQLLPLDAPLRVCLMSADFYGLPNPGPIAIHFHLLAQTLTADPSMQVHSHGK